MCNTAILLTLQGYILKYDRQRLIEEVSVLKRINYMWHLYILVWPGPSELSTSAFLNYVGWIDICDKNWWMASLMQRFVWTKGTHQKPCLLWQTRLLGITFIFCDFVWSGILMWCNARLLSSYFGCKRDIERNAQQVCQSWKDQSSYLQVFITSNWSIFIELILNKYWMRCFVIIRKIKKLNQKWNQKNQKIKNHFCTCVLLAKSLWLQLKTLTKHWFSGYHNFFFLSCCHNVFHSPVTCMSY